MSNFYHVSALACTVLAVINLAAFKKRRIDFSYCIFWLVMSLSMVILTYNVDWFESLSDLLKIDYAPSLLFSLAFIFLFAFIFYLTTVITKLRGRITKLTQEVGLLKNKTEEDSL